MILNRDLEKILNISISMSKEDDYSELLQSILEDGMDISNCDAGTLYILNDNKLEFFFMVTKSLNVREGGVGHKISLPPVDINSSSVAAMCARTKRIINVDDVYTDTKYNWEGPKKYDSLTGYHTQSVLVLPLLDREKSVLGVMQLINATSFNNVIPFSNDVERIIYSLSSLSGILLNNMRLYDDIKDLLHSFVSAMVKAIESRTPYNAFHTVNVAKICEEFANYLDEKKYYDIKPQDKEELYLAAMLHDVGKMIIPNEILNKATRLEGLLDNMLLRYDLIKSCTNNKYLKKEISDKDYKNEIEFIDKAKDFIVKVDKSSFLTDEDKEFIEVLKNKSYDTEFGKLLMLTDKEYENASIAKGTLTKDERKEIEKHVVYTSEILNEIKFGKKYQSVKEIASKHHEYLNGTGYPDHLNEKDLPLLVRIITIVDIYESLISTDRPYKKPMPNEKALAILKEMADEGKLDSKLVEEFTELRK
ncbi:MAG: HD domain-containing protein [Acholeplasmatales bacterium]|nr:HD domain-containing protein [Acholeplasmatales bacterium]